MQNLVTIATAGQLTHLSRHQNDPYRILRKVTKFGFRFSLRCRENLKKQLGVHFVTPSQDRTEQIHLLNNLKYYMEFALSVVLLNNERLMIAFGFIVSVSQTGRSLLLKAFNTRFELLIHS